MKKILLFLLLSNFFQAFAQNVTYQRLKARKIKDYVILRVEDIEGKKQITREIESRDGTIKSHPLKNGELYLASTESSFNIIFDFMNPLLYKVEIKEQTSPDPIYSNINSFYDQLGNLVQTTQKLPSPPFGSEKKISENKTAGTDNATKASDLSQYKSDDILDWKMWEYQYSKDTVQFFNKKSMQFIYTHVSAIDDFLNNQQFESSVKKMIEDLQNAKTLSDFRLVVAKAKKDIKITSDTNETQVKEIQTTGGTNITWNFSEPTINPLKINSEFITNYNKKSKVVYTIATLTKAVNDSIDKNIRGTVFKTYTEKKISNYLASAENIMKQRKEITKRVEDLLALLDSYLQTRVYTCRASCEYIKGGVVVFDDDEVADVTVTITGLSYNFDDYRQEPSKEVYQAILKVSNYTSVIPEFGLGAFYALTDISFPKYGTSTDAAGNTIIASAGEDKLRLIPSAVLNLVGNWGYGPAYPMLQFGVGSGKVMPTFSTGVGTKIFSFKDRSLRNVSISIGGIWHWAQQLDKLKIGDPVKGTADINNDLTYVLQPPSWYLGIHFNF